MADYTYSEIMRMQNDAIKRVEDMQRRARETAGFSEERERKSSSESHSQKQQNYKVSRSKQNKICNTFMGDTTKHY